MTRFVVARLGQAGIVVLLVTLVVFFLQHLLPGNEARAVLGLHAGAAQVKSFDQQNGLSQPLPVQYLDYLWRILHGNLGFSYKLNESVDSLLANDIPNDLSVVIPAFVISLAIAIPLGIRQAIRRNKAFDYLTTTFVFVLYSIPSFWLGLLLVAWFAVDLNWLPAQAPQASSIGGLLADPRSCCPS